MQSSSNPSSDPEEVGLPDAAPTSATTARRRVNWLREALETLVPAVLLALLINMFVAQATRVDGPSMQPLLKTDQRVVVEKLSYRFHAPRRGDVVVIKLPHNPAELLIKRVVALGGETIEVRDGSVWIDGQQLPEDYCAQPTASVMAPQKVPENTVFVLGDNRGFSNDSRSFGPVSLGNVVGRAVFTYWPPSDIGFLH